MVTPATTVYVHVGYPKTATTTFQKHLFPGHPEIDYLGKFIPGFGFRTESLENELNALISRDDTRYEGTQKLAELIRQYRGGSHRPALLISTESIVHPWATDRGLVARRLHEALSPCRIIVTIREQLDSIKSYYGRHGRFGQYLFLTKETGEQLSLPMTLPEWLTYSLRTSDKNYIGTLRYYETISYYAKLFGRDNVGVFLYEEFVRDQEAYVRRLCRFLGVHDVEKAVELVRGRHELPSLTRGELFFLRIESRLPAALRMDGLHRLGRKLSALVPRASSAGAISIDPPWLEQLAALYRESNRKLQQTFDLPLERYGYLL
ncbi:MAG TPA: sulfotransferase domain-containing protein [Nitrospira sp.]|nr:sulfotransferase domain-containing protein [Nitrospira sp.]